LHAILNVTLAYARSLDGSIAAKPGERTQLSGPEAMAYTHRLRAEHDAILVGVNTVRVDNPRLTVRLAPGPNPQPVVLDSQLRTPLDCALVAAPAHPLWVLCAVDAPVDRERDLTERGVRVMRVDWPVAHHERWPFVLDALAAAGCASLMVEGGAQVIASLTRAGLYDRLSITHAPVTLDGLRPNIVEGRSLPIRNSHVLELGVDKIVETYFEREDGR
jgi:3,4-dihydroxy 2-butanone 4-phosphate synthase/GTP cyclohydrolase II